MSFVTALTALYEGYVVVHFAPLDRAAVETSGRTPGLAAKIPGTTQSPRSPGKRRTRHGAIAVLFGAIWNAIQSAALWIEEKALQAHYRRLESYLAQSSDHADLERRMRELDYHKQFNWIDCGSH